jgi:hypothetical protein
MVDVGNVASGNRELPTLDLRLRQDKDLRVIRKV